MGEALHRGCTWNCSVKRAQVYFEKRKFHEGTIDAQLQRLHAVEQELYAARHRVVELKMGAHRKVKSPSCRSAVSARYAQEQRFDEMSLQSFEMPGARLDEDDFLSCASDDSLALQRQVTDAQDSPENSPE